MPQGRGPSSSSVVALKTFGEPAQHCLGQAGASALCHGRMSLPIDSSLAPPIKTHDLNQCCWRWASEPLSLLQAPTHSCVPVSVFKLGSIKFIRICFSKL